MGLFGFASPALTWGALEQIFSRLTLSGGAKSVEKLWERLRSVMLILGWPEGN